MKALLAIIILSALALAGCTSSGGDTFVTPDQDDQGRYVVHMLGSNEFRPKNIEIPTGATVVWVADTGGHTATADDGSWNSGIVSKGDTFEYTFDSPGIVDYHCIPHEGIGMVGTIKVVDSMTAA